ncbi:MAG TPA: protease modulator HflC [Alphaproteobacteria bacterium]|nr:protease modulator HflC [Alphaproteobacteria bacterium]
MGRGRMLLIGGLLLLALITVLSATFVVKQYEQAIVLEFGQPRRDTRVEPGLYFKKPFIQNVVYFDKRILDHDVPDQELIVSDQKRLVVDSFARYKIVDALEFYRTVGTEEVGRARLQAILNASTREVLGKVPLITVVSGERASLMDRITELVNGEAKTFGVDVIDVRIRRADLPPENSEAIYQRMQTERDREAKENRARGAEVAQRVRASADRERTVLLAEANREAQIIRGKGDAEAVRISAEAFSQDPEFFAFYRTMLAYTNSLGAADTTMILSPRSEFFDYFGSAVVRPGGER